MRDYINKKINPTETIRKNIVIIKNRALSKINKHLVY